MTPGSPGMESPSEIDTPGEHPDPLADASHLLRDLIRIDTSNDGTDDVPGEILAAEYVVEVLKEVGYDPELITTTSGIRAGVHLRIPGIDPDRPALLIHGHLDVVPAVASDWTVPPFAAEIVDDMIWGRGAVDMKDTDAMILAVIRDWARKGYRPPRDVVVLFTPDEEAGGKHGAHWFVDHRPDLFHGVTEAVGEVGGFSLSVRDDLRLYLIQTAEKGIAWMRLSALGTAGHGSMINEDNAVTELAEAVARIGRHRFPTSLGPTAQRMVAELAEAYGLAEDASTDEVLSAIGPIAKFIGSGVRNTANPSMLAAGYKVNVIPEHAHAHVDGRFVPGGRDELVNKVRELAGPRVSVELLNDDVALEVPFQATLVEAMTAALLVEDPEGMAIPYLLSGGTDAKAFSRLGITGYGFAPLRLPPDLDFAALFHGVDERVPLSSVAFGVRVLDRFLRSS
jgi:acetylornithine deacetylase/succinyl-diaminopimelate desuccinylase-like protein